MEINGLIPGAGEAISGTTGINGAQSADLGRDEFLLLLVTQLSNQDPLNPMDGQEFASQLAQFSSLEQLVSMNDALAQNGEINGLLAQSINSGVASGLIGKEIEAEGNTFQMLGDKSQALRFDLGEAATSISIEIFNEAGEKVRTVDLGQRGAGEQEYVWDGADNDGNQLAAGNFTFNVVAKDAGGSDVATTTFTRGVVDRITFGPDGIFLWVGQTSVSMGDVNSVGEPGESHE